MRLAQRDQQKKAWIWFPLVHLLLFPSLRWHENVSLREEQLCLLFMKLNLHVLTRISPGFQSRRCRCWRARSWGWSSSSRCSWTRVTGRAREAGRASTSWSMSLRSEPKFSSLTSTRTGSKSSPWTSEAAGPDDGERFSVMSLSRMFFLHTLAFCLLDLDVVGHFLPNVCVAFILGMCAFTPMFAPHRTFIVLIFVIYFMLMKDMYVLTKPSGGL